MDNERFDHFTRSVAAVSRRRVSRLGLGGLAALTFGMMRLGETEAKPRRCGGETCGGKCCTGRRSRKKFCVPKSYTCCPTGDACDSSHPKCCPRAGRPPQARGTCARRRGVCCPWNRGGHACSADFPVCCTSRPGFEFGLCSRAGRLCCPVGAGTSCPVTHPVCCPAVGPTPKYCCTSGSICGFGDCVFGGPFTAQSDAGESADDQPAQSAQAL
jgi:hypothetical protein